MKRINFLTLICVAFIMMGTMVPAWSGVLVFGGTGQLGVRVVNLLLAAGEDVTVFVRPTSDRSRLDGLEVNYLIGDVRNEDDVAAAFESAKFRVVIVALRVPLSEPGFYELVSRNIISNAASADVKQIINHGAVGAGDNMALHPEVPWDMVPGLRDRMEDRGRAEANYLNSGFNTTILRNSRVWPDDTPSSGHAELTEDQRAFTPITRVDLARFTMDCLDNVACANKIFHASDTTLSWPPPSAEEGGD